MVIVGVDAHKRTHTFVAVDAVGRRLAERTLPATQDGHLEAIRWAGRWPDRCFAVEDCRHVSRRLEGDLLAAGESVVRVPTKLMAGERRGVRQRGKSDPIDALAVARAALREPDLPRAQLDGPARELRLLVDHREDLVGERTRMQSRVRWHLHELFPGLEIRPRSLRQPRVLRDLQERLVGLGLQSGVVVIAGELIVRCSQLTERINALERQIRQLVQDLAPTLLALHGCGALTAAKIVGEVAGVARFRSKAAFAAWNGTAPIPVWSGNTARHRLNRGGNRQVNASLHRIALTQCRDAGLGAAYVQRRITEGDTRTEALRLLRRRISDEVYRRLLTDDGPGQNESPGHRAA